MSGTVHAACVAWDGAGVLIRGPSGAGKSSLALLLCAAGCAFVADDRVRLALVDDCVMAAPHPELAGRVEVRGQGLLAAADDLGLAVLAQAPLALAVDLVEAAPRLPEPPDPARILGIALPRLVLDRGARAAGLAPLLVRAALRRAVTSQPHTAAESRDRGAPGSAPGAPVA